MSRHQRLKRNLRSPARSAKQAKRARRQARYPEGRPREYVAMLMPRAALESAFAHRHGAR